MGMSIKKRLRKRIHGFEPRIKVWKTLVLPLHHIRIVRVEGFASFYCIPCRGALLLASLSPHQWIIRHNEYYVKSPITELNCSLQFTKLLHHHNAYRADSPGRDWTYNISINSRTHLPIELLGIIRNRSSMENRRLELLTSYLQSRRTTNCANSPKRVRRDLNPRPTN